MSTMMIRHSHDDGDDDDVMQLIADLPSIFRTVMKKNNLAPGDFPEINDYQSKLKEMEFTKFHSLKQKLIDDIDGVMATDIPRLMEALPRSLDGARSAIESAMATPALDFGNGPTQSTGYAVAEESNPWAADDGMSPAGASNPYDEGESKWALQPYVSQYSDQFNKLQSGGQVSGAAARPVLSASGLPNASLRKIWDLADVGKDGQLSLQEFVIAMYLIDQAKMGMALPATLDPSLIPSTA